MVVIGGSGRDNGAQPLPQVVLKMSTEIEK